MNILITGASGFVGGHLAELLRVNTANTLTLASRTVKDGFVTFDPKYTTNFELTPYDVIYHLSSQASVHISFEKPFETFDDNLISTMNLVRMINEQKRTIKLVVSGSAEVYKASMIPLNEKDPLLPRSPYGISKQIAELYLQGMAKYLKLNTTIIRTFNTTGPRQAIKFALPNFAKQIAEIEIGKVVPILYAGDLTVQRDFTDIRDTIRAFELVSSVQEYGEVYNICSGTQYTIGELLNRMIKIAGIDVEIMMDNKRLRPNDVPVYIGDNTKFVTKFGWKPEFTIDDTLKTLLDYWRDEVKK